MQRAGGDAELAQAGDLVIHQRDEGGNDDRGARAAEGGHLVADAFAAAGRHQHEGVAARHDMLDRLLLQAAKARETEDAVQDLGWVGERVQGWVRLIRPPLLYRDGSLKAMSGQAVSMLQTTAQGPSAAVSVVFSVQMMRPMAAGAPLTD